MSRVYRKKMVSRAQTPHSFFTFYRTHLQNRLISGLADGPIRLRAHKLNAPTNEINIDCKMMDEGVYREIVEACRPFYIYPHHNTHQGGSQHRLLPSSLPLLHVSIPNNGIEHHHHHQRLTPSTTTEADPAHTGGAMAKVSR